MTTQQAINELLTETERLWLMALKARRAAVTKQREYKAALLEWIEAKAKQKTKEEAG